MTPEEQVNLIREILNEILKLDDLRLIAVDGVLKGMDLEKKTQEIKGRQIINALD